MIRDLPQKIGWTTKVRRVYLVVFDKSGGSLSGWHYRKLHELDVKWIQQSVVGMSNIGDAEEFANLLHEFGVQDVRIFRVTETTDKCKVYVGT